MISHLKLFSLVKGPRWKTDGEPLFFILILEYLLVCCQVMAVVGPSSVADGLPLLHLSLWASDVPSAALQLSRGPTGCRADPGRPQFTDRMQPHLILVSKVRTVPSCFCVCLCFVGRVNRASRTFWSSLVWWRADILQDELQGNWIACISDQKVGSYYGSYFL